MSEASEAIFKEQRQLRKEKLLANPALIIGAVGFVVILIVAVLVPLLSKVDPNAMTVCCCIFLHPWHDHRCVCKLFQNS